MLKKLLVGALLCLSMLLVTPAQAETDVMEFLIEESHSHFLNNDMGGELSHLTFITENDVYMYLYSGISVADFVKINQDLVKIKDYTEFRTINLILNSPGGSAFDGLSIADMIVNYQDHEGFRFNVYASGIVASAAVPIFAVCKQRMASPGTLFMVHEAALWKWPGRETSSDIIAQGELMKKLQALYLSFLVDNSNLSIMEWKLMEKKTTWFTVDQAREIGLIERTGGSSNGRK